MKLKVQRPLENCYVVGKRIPMPELQDHIAQARATRQHPKAPEQTHRDHRLCSRSYSFDAYCILEDFILFKKTWLLLVLRSHRKKIVESDAACGIKKWASRDVSLLAMVGEILTPTTEAQRNGCHSDPSCLAVVTLVSLVSLLTRCRRNFSS